VDTRLPLGVEAAVGRVSAPVPATHCQLPLFEVTSPSTSCSWKCAAPTHQSTPSAFVRKAAATSRCRFGM
jgi:hypothetical protein